MNKGTMLNKITEAEKVITSKIEEVKNGKMRQHYHFMPPTGWLNDPNGLIYFKNKYHFFYQFNPYSPFWDSMHWGHAISDDMLHWEHLPVALAPSEEYDDYQKGGCFSGSAIEHDDKLFLVYTGSVSNGNGDKQVQCVAYSEDGINFEKYSGNPVLTAPQGIPDNMFRDPKVWKHQDTYYMVCGAGSEDKGKALLYKSKDMLNWTFFNVLAESRGEYGYMWECPDFYQLGDKFVLTFSPMGLGSRIAVYMVGDFDYSTGKFMIETTDEIDWGFDFYAPQSFLAPNNRRITVGWSNSWKWMPHWQDWGPTYKEGWCGSFNIPREVRLTENNKLQFIPINEIESIRENEYKVSTLIINDTNTEIQTNTGNIFELKFEIDLANTTADKMELDLRSDGTMMTKCTFDFKKSEMSVDRNNADGWSKGTTKSVMFLKGRQSLDVHILSDKSSLEIFTNNYTNNHSVNVYPKENQNKIFARSYNGNVAINNLVAFSLKNTSL